MYPKCELIRLGAHKVALRQRIDSGRVACAAAATQALRPVRWLDNVMALWKQVAAGALPLSFVAAQLFSRRAPRLGALVRWSPVLFGLVRGLYARPAAAPVSAPQPSTQEKTMAKKSRGGRMTAAKNRAAKRRGGKGPVAKRAAGRHIMKT